MAEDRADQQPQIPEQRGEAPPAQTGGGQIRVFLRGSYRRLAASLSTVFQQLIADRPQYFPSVFAWLVVGMGRSWRGATAALISTWFYVPLAFLVGALAAVVALVVALVSWIFNTVRGERPNTIVAQVQATAADLPVFGEALDVFMVRLGLIGAILGVIVWFVAGFLAVFLLPWLVRFLADPVSALGVLMGVVAFGLFLGLLYTLYRIALEGRILRIAGARRLSRREQELILPILRDCTRLLGLQNAPPVLINDRRDPNAAAYTRHIVINQGLLEEFQYDRDVIAAVLCHELVHWRNGDAIAAAFVRGVALPLYLTQVVVGALMRNVGHPVISAVLWCIFWPVLVTVNYVIMPIQAADARRAEFQADQGAVLAGYRAGIRTVISRLRRSFESGRNGWDEAVCAWHPPNELRLERLEDPAMRYSLPDPHRTGDRPAGSAAGLLRQE